MNSLRKKISAKRKKVVFWTVLSLLLLGVLGLIHDIIITHILAYRICKADPQPKTFIKKTIEYPESIYWEDNVYPGFDEKDRLLMIHNYLDGVHLKTMALNAPDGTIYVYTATEEDWRESGEIHAREKSGDYFKTLDLESRKIAERGVTYTQQTMPRLNYSVIFRPVSLTTFERRYLWSDEVKIVDNQTSEIIAYNRRLMRRWYMIAPDFALGNRYYSPKAMCGKNYIYGFDEAVFTYSDFLFRSAHIGINRYLYEKMMEGKNAE